MRFGKVAWLLLAVAPFLAGCADFWEDSASFTLSNSGDISVSPGSDGTSTITVTPKNSFSGTVTLDCAISSEPSSATSPATCDLSSSSLTVSSSTATTSTLTVSTSSSTTTGAYDIKVTGTSGSETASTTVCAEVSSSSGACSSSSSSGNFYILNNLTSSTFQVVGYSIASGSLSALTGPSAQSGQAYAMAIDPNGKFLFVSSSNGIYLYTIGSNGALSIKSSSPVIADTAAYALKVDSTGEWLLDASNSGPILYAYPINPSTGVSTLSSGASAPHLSLASSGSIGLGGMAISSDNKLIAVAVGTETDTLTFSADSSSPINSSYSYNTAKGTAVSVAFDPNTKYLYIGETNVFTTPANNSGALRIIPISSNVLGSEPSTSPYHSGGTGPHSILAASNGYVYVANWIGTSAGNVTAFKVVSSGPALTLQSNSVATGVEPYSIAEDSTDGFVLVVNNQGSPYFNAYTFNSSTTGQLDSSLTGSTGDGPVAIVAAP